MSKIFISYKYGDTSVKHLARNAYWEMTKVRDYVDELQEKISESDHINKGEQDGEDLSAFKDDTIESKLRDKIWDSTVTIVLISPNMKEAYVEESNQWIPWEVAYSLREYSRNGRTSHTNALLGVVLPDKEGNYEYCISSSNCTGCSCRIIDFSKSFKILRDNLFNKKKKDDLKKPCNQGSDVYTGFVSYMHLVQWDHFIGNIDVHVNLAINNQDNKEDFEITKSV